MRIMSCNCWAGRVPGLVGYLASTKADVYCLQEVLSSPPETPDELLYIEEGKPPELQRPKLFQELAAGLPGYQALFFPSAFGYLHDGATTPHPAQYGIAAFVRQSVPIISSLSRFVYGEYRSERWGDPPLPRIAHVMRVWNYEQNKPLVIAHTHGMWISGGKHDTDERVTQGSKLLRMIWDIRVADDPVVVCGDFNVLPDSTMLAHIKNVAPVELVTSRGHTDTRTSFYKKTPRYADYMLVSRDIRVESFKVPSDPEVSDHRPLILDISKYPATESAHD